MATVVNQWSLADIGNYGVKAVQVANTDGNALVAYLGWNAVQVQPVSNMADDANNWWIHLGTVTPPPGNLPIAVIRAGIWIAPNARANTIVSAALSWFAQGFVGLIVEYSGLPAWITQDGVAMTGQIANGTGVTLTIPATAAQADHAFAVAISADNTKTITPSGAPWNALTQVSINDPAGAGGPRDTKIVPIWYSPAAGAVSAAWTASVGTDQAGLVCLIAQTGTPPSGSQFNPYWPVFKTEMALGYQPGDPTAIPVWTDVTQYAGGPAMEAQSRVTRGRAYELSQSEAGEYQVQFDNSLGNFTPGNSASPFYDNALNANWDFETGTSPWVAGNGATLSQSTLWAQTGTHSALFTGNGTTAQPQISSDQVNPTYPYFTASAWLFSPQGWASGVQVLLLMRNSGGTIIATYTSGVNVLPANTPVLFSVPGWVVNGTAHVTMTVQAAGTPANTVQFLVDDAAITPMFQPFQTGCMRLGVPVRTWAAWHNRIYGIGAGYAERLPQQFPYFTQWQWSRLVASDGIAMLSNSTLYSATIAETLIDAPYGLWPLTENYAAGASGRPFANVSKTNQKAAIGSDGSTRSGTAPFGGYAAVPLQTGQSLGLLGDTGSGVGLSGNTTANLPGAPGVIYTDAGIPQAAGGVTWSAWINIPATIATGSDQSLWWVMGTANNYAATNQRGVRIRVSYIQATGLAVTFGAFPNFHTQVTAAAALNDGKPHHVVVTLKQGASGQHAWQIFLDGALANSGTFNFGVGVTLNDAFQAGFGSPMPDNGDQIFAWNYVVGRVSVFSGVLAPSRIAAQYQAGATGWSGDSNVQRFAKLMTWSGYGLARAGDLGSPTPLFGPADSISGQSASQAVAAVGSTDQGMVYCDAKGTVTCRSRVALYNKTPRWVFGDSPPEALNPGWEFQDGNLGFWAMTGGTAVASQAQVYVSPWSCLFTPNGVATTSILTNRGQFPATPGSQWLVTAWVFSPLGYSNIGIGINWYDSTHTQLSVTRTTVSAPAGQWTRISSAVLTAPANTAFIAPSLVEGGTPPASATLYIQQLKLTTTSTEIPFMPSQEFGYDNSFLYGFVTSQRSISSGAQGVLAQALDQTSVIQYFQRGALSIAIETTADQDAYDLANMLLTKYKQPSIRTSQITLMPGGNPEVWDAAMGVEQADIAQVVRRPLQGITITETGVIQRIEHQGGPGTWQTILSIVPYSPFDHILTSGVAGYDVVGSNYLAW